MNIKQSLLLLIAFISAFYANAQPSDADITKRSKENGAIEVRFTSEHGTVHYPPSGKYYERTFEAKIKTDAPGVYKWERGDYRYNYSGGKWVFYKYYPSSSWYDGIANPTEAEIINVLEKSEAGYQGAVYEKPVYHLPENPKWNWHTFNSVEFLMEVTYWKRTNPRELSKIKRLISVRLYRDCGNGQYNYKAQEAYVNAPWLNVLMAHFPSTYDGEVLEVKKLSESEAYLEKTLWERQQEGDKVSTGNVVNDVPTQKDVETKAQTEVKEKVNETKLKVPKVRVKIR